MITYQEELVENLIEELKPLLVKHWDELANHKDTRPLNPSFDYYIRLSQAGKFKIITARDADRLIGYVCYVIAPNPHYIDWLYAVCDVYFIDPEYRYQGVGADLFKYAEEFLKMLGVKSTTAHVKVNHPHDALFTSAGYVLVERHFEKVL